MNPSAQDSTFYLAEMNVAYSKYPIDDPKLKDFMDAIHHVNQAAKTFPGYVWRLGEEEEEEQPTKNPTNPAQPVVIHHPIDGYYLLVNMSIWQDVSSLRHYIFSSPHLDIMKRRHEWFDRVEKITTAMWWVDVTHHGYPTEKEGFLRLNYLQQHGASPYAFSFRERFDKPTTQA